MTHPMGTSYSETEIQLLPCTLPGAEPAGFIRENTGKGNSAVSRLESKLGITVTVSAAILRATWTRLLMPQVSRSLFGRWGVV